MFQYYAQPLTVDSIAITISVATTENKNLNFESDHGPSGSLLQPHGIHYHWASQLTTENPVNYFPQLTLGFQRLYLATCHGLSNNSFAHSCCINQRQNCQSEFPISTE